MTDADELHHQIIDARLRLHMLHVRRLMEQRKQRQPWYARLWKWVTR